VKQHLDLNLLRTFATVARTKNYSKAASLLYRTQPAITLQMQRLEEQVGGSLFLRNGREVTVTETGRVLLNYATRILNLEEEALIRLSASEAEGTIRIGILEEIAMGPLSEILTRFGKLCERIHLEIHVGTSAVLVEMIQKNKLCLAVADEYYNRKHSILLWQEDYAWIGSQEMESVNRDPLPLVVPVHRCRPRDIAYEALRKQGRNWKVVLSSTSLYALQAAVRAGLGVGVMAKSLLSGGLRSFGEGSGLPDLPGMRIALHRSTGAVSEAVDLLAAFLIENLSQPE
jgi:DNA-binding transcriptional LysR family regulator